MFGVQIMFLFYVRCRDNVCVWCSDNVPILCLVSRLGAVADLDLVRRIKHFENEDVMVVRFP